MQQEEEGIEKEETADNCTNGENGDDITVNDDLYNDNFNEEYNGDEVMRKIRGIVAEIRKICSYIKNSTKCKEILEELQLLTQCERVLNVSLDMRTRWNSTLEMLRKALKLKEPIEKFLKFLNIKKNIIFFHK